MRKFIEENILFKNAKHQILAGVLRQVKTNKLSPMILICHGFAAHKNSLGNIQLVNFLTK